MLKPRLRAQRCMLRTTNRAGLSSPSSSHPSGLKNTNPRTAAAPQANIPPKLTSHSPSIRITTHLGTMGNYSFLEVLTRRSVTNYALVSLAWSLSSSCHSFPQAGPACIPSLSQNGSRCESGAVLGLGCHSEQNRASSCLRGAHSLAGKAK